MLFLLWDASALVKQYTPEAKETGSENVQVLFNRFPLSQMITTVIGYAEVYAILVRKHNEGKVLKTSFDLAVSAIQSDIIDNPEFGLLSVTDAAILNSLSLIKRHNINSSDATILTIFLQYQEIVSDDLVLVSTDKRLLRAAKAEGLDTYDPKEPLPDYLMPKLSIRQRISSMNSALTLKIRAEIAALNEDRVDDLKRRIKKGVYGVPSDTIARDIIETLPEIRSLRELDG